MMSCKESTLLISAAEDRDLSLKEKLALEMHLSMCEGCSRYRKQVGFLRKAVRRRPAHEAPPPDPHEPA